MAKLDEQKQALVDYFRRGCKPQGPLTLGLEAEHFLTHAGGEPVTFAEVQGILRQMQRAQDAPITIDGLYMGYTAAQYSVTLEPACQLEVSIAPQSDVRRMLAVYDQFRLQMDMALAARGLRAWNTGYHPTCRAEDLPLIPKQRYEAMDRYFHTTGAGGIQMMRATASTQLSIDYYSEQDFVQKMRAACLLTPLLALLTDSAAHYQGHRNSGYSVRTRIWQDVDDDRCGVPPHLMEPDFGFARYAETVLTRPLIVALQGGHTVDVGEQTAQQVYGAQLQQSEIEHILSMFFFDVRLKNYLEIRGADSMPAPYIAAYAQLIKAIFSSQAALQNVLRHYAGMGTVDIANAKLAVCRDGYGAWVYGRPVAQELTWLLLQARSRISSPEDRAQLAPFAALVAGRKTIKEQETDL